LPCRPLHCSLRRLRRPPEVPVPVPVHDVQIAWKALGILTRGNGNNDNSKDADEEERRNQACLCRGSEPAGWKEIPSPFLHDPRPQPQSKNSSDGLKQDRDEHETRHDDGCLTKVIGQAVRSLLCRCRPPTAKRPLPQGSPFAPQCLVPLPDGTYQAAGWHTIAKGQLVSLLLREVCCRRLSPCRIGGRRVLQAEGGKHATLGVDLLRHQKSDGSEGYCNTGEEAPSNIEQIERSCRILCCAVNADHGNQRQGACPRQKTVERKHHHLRDGKAS